MADAVVVRRAQPGDHAWILALHDAAFRPVTRPEFIQNFLARARRMLRRPVWVVEISGERAGYVAVQPFGPMVLLGHSLGWEHGDPALRQWTGAEDWRRHLAGGWVVTAIAVDPAFRRRGAGQALVQRCVADAMDQGIPSVVAMCVDGSGSAELFQGAGFRPVVTVADWYPGPLSSHVVLLPLAPPRAKVPFGLFPAPTRPIWARPRFVALSVLVGLGRAWAWTTERVRRWVRPGA